jgi:MinD-like ATPase involved in chromosome partitioning or flagellar assembly
MEQSVRVGGDTGQPVVVSWPDSDAAKSFQAIACQVAARISVEALNSKAAPAIKVE